MTIHTIHKLDAVGRERALTDAESRELEAALRARLAPQAWERGPGRAATGRFPYREHLTCAEWR